MCTSQLKAIKLCEFPMKIHFRCVGMVSGISVWWHCKWRKWRIVFCVAVLPKHQRNVMRAVRVSSLNLLWEDLTKARISLPLRLRCHPEEKWECRKSFWQLCVLKREAACSRHHFIGSPSSCCREKGSETTWFKCWCVCLKWCKRVRSTVDEWRDTQRRPKVHQGTSIQPLSRIWTSRNSANSFTKENRGFIAFFENVNLNV